MAEKDAQASAVANVGDRNAVIAPLVPESKFTERNIRLPRLGALRYHDCNQERESLCYHDNSMSLKQPKRSAVVTHDEDTFDPLRFTATHLRLPTSVVTIDGPNDVRLSANPSIPAKKLRNETAHDRIANMLENNRSSFIMLTLQTAPKYFYMPQTSTFDEIGLEVGL